MKITKITREDGIYRVTQVPNFLERIFGKKERTVRYRRAYGYKYLLGGGVYYNEEGEETGCGNKVGEALDRFDRSF